MKTKVNTKLIISELHKAFGYLNRDLFEGKLPEPAILIQSRGNKKLCLGWCTIGKVWKNEYTQEERYEINLVAEALNRGLFPVMTTFIHEMVHLYHLENNIKGVSRGNTYHNKRFKEDCERIGMIVEHDDKVGWSHCQLTPYLMELIKSYGLSEEAFAMGRIDTDGEKENKTKKSSSRKYICPECGMTVRASKDVLILCGLCTNVEENKIVPLIKELTEDDEKEMDLVEHFCLECGEVHMLPRGSVECPSCGGILEEMNPISEEDEEESEPPVVEVEDEEEVEIQNPVEIQELPVGLGEVDTQLDDGLGNIVDVKQIVIDVPVVEENLEKREWSKTENTGWDIERIREVIRCSAKLIGETATFDYESVDISIKKMKPYGKCYWKMVKTRGRGADKLVVEKLQFSEEHLRIHSDADIVDTIKHEFIHAWVDCMKNKDQKHNDIWKRYCVKIGCNPSATATLKPIK